MRVLCVWHDYGTGFLSHLLRPGFRHVFCAVDDGRYWIRLDGQDGVPVIEVVAGSDYDLETFYRAEGFRVLCTDGAGHSAAAPFMLATCVGLVKQIVGIRAPWVLTPHQLYRALRKRPAGNGT